MGGVHLRLHPFLTVALDGGDKQTSRPGRLPRRRGLTVPDE
jgi:hypothetical protein